MRIGASAICSASSSVSFRSLRTNDRDRIGRSSERLRRSRSRSQLRVLRARHGVHVHKRHQLGRHDDERAHHVAVFVLEDVAVVHVAPAEDLEADDDVDHLVRIDADGVFQAELVVVERV